MLQICGTFGSVSSVEKNNCQARLCAGQQPGSLAFLSPRGGETSRWVVGRQCELHLEMHISVASSVPDLLPQEMTAKLNPAGQGQTSQEDRVPLGILEVLPIRLESCLVSVCIFHLNLFH